MNKTKSFPLILFAISIPFIVYFFFINWQPHTIYGDDLIIYMAHSKQNGFADKMNLLIPMGKYRPVNGFVLNLLIGAFQRNLTGYFLFNIGVQAINIFLFASLLNFFLKSPFASLLVALTLGLSRFALYNVTQLLYGGVMEGLALTFFLASLFFLLKAVVRDPLSPSQKTGEMILSVVFANLSMYTHERYIVIFPFIILAVFFFTSLRALTRNQRIGLVAFAVTSMILNFVTKSYILSIPYFMGTGGQAMSFSFSSSLSFYFEALLSIVQINLGPEYLVGVKFASLPAGEKFLILLLIGGLTYLLLAYINKIRKRNASIPETRDSVRLIILLAILLNLLLVPAVSTIRLEPRWLQASFAVFILMVAILISEFPFKNDLRRGGLIVSLVVLYITTDYIYLLRGSNNYSLIYAETMATTFRQAIDNGDIRPETEKLYLWEKQRDPNNESGIQWELSSGGFFEYYQGRPKKIYFADSLYSRAYAFPVSSFGNFDKKTTQIFMLQPQNVVDITNDYLLDSLRTFATKSINGLGSLTSTEFNQRHLRIEEERPDRFLFKGFYKPDNDLQWTDGNASIQILHNYSVADSFSVELNTYMPPVCEKVYPKVTLTDDANNVMQPFSSQRDGDRFTFRFAASHPVSVQTISILSDTLQTPSATGKKLSFPFVGLTLNKLH